MSEGKKFFILNYDLIDILDKMPNEKAGELFKHVLAFVNDKQPTSDDALINIVFDVIRKDMAEEYNRRQNIKIRRSAARKNVLLQKSEQKDLLFEKKEQKEVLFQKSEQKDVLFEKTQQSTTKIPKLPKEPKLDYQQIIDIFNQTCTELPRASLTDDRKRLIDRILKTYTLEQIGQVFQITRDSDYLNGRVKEWRANLTWILSPNNFVKILEGNYTQFQVKKIENDDKSELQAAKDAVSKYFDI
jgi:hypothetical protein